MLSLQSVERKKYRSTRLRCIGLYNTKTTSILTILISKKMDTIIMILCNGTMMGTKPLKKKKSFIRMITAIKVPKRESAIREIIHMYRSLRDKILSISVARQTNLTLVSLKSKFKTRSLMKRTTIRTQSKKKRKKQEQLLQSPMIVFGVKINKKNKKLLKKQSLMNIIKS